MTARQRLLDMLATKQSCTEVDAVRDITQALFWSSRFPYSAEARAYAWLADQLENLP